MVADTQEMVMDNQGLKHKFDRAETAREFVNWLVAIAKDDYTLAGEGELRWAEVWPMPRITPSRDGTPLRVKYIGSYEEPFLDPINGQERTRHVEVEGVSLKLERLFGSGTRITIQCHLQQFEPLYYKLLELCGQVTPVTAAQTTVGDDNTTPEQESKKPWELIPDIGYDRTLVKLWHREISAKAIGMKVGKDEKTIEGRVRTLRTKYEDKVPNLLPSRKGS
jgi:hypothetical protein